MKNTRIMRLNTKVKKEEENMKEKHNEDINFVDLLSGITENDAISSNAGPKDLACRSITPVFYGCNNGIVNVPNPYDIVMKNLNDTIESISEDIVNKAFNNIKYCDRIISDLLSNATNLICKTYMDAFSNNIISYFSIRLSRYVPELFPSELLDNLLGILFDPNHLSFSLRSFVNDTMVLISNTSINTNDRNLIMYYNICMARNEIMTEISSALNYIIRSNAFGSPYISNRNSIKGTNSSDRHKAVIELLYDDIKDDNINKSILFTHMMCQLNADLEQMTPLIETLLWQIVSIINKLLSKEMKDHIIRLFDMYDNYYK